MIMVLMLLGTVSQIAVADNTNIIERGQSVDKVIPLMKECGYKETVLLQWLSADKDTEVMAWVVGEGVMIVGFSAKNRKVLGLTYYSHDEREKAVSTRFCFQVTEFNPKTQEMKIKLSQKVPDPNSAPAPQVQH